MNYFACGMLVGLRLSGFFAMWGYRRGRVTGYLDGHRTCKEEIYGETGPDTNPRVPAE